MKRLTGMITALLILIGVFGSNTYAATKTVDVILEEDCEKCVFSIVWENADQTAEVEVISPTGQKFGKTETPEQTTISDGGIYIHAGYAQAGTWKVVITGEKLGRVDVSAGELPGAMNIDRFEVDADGEGEGLSYRAVWSVSDSAVDLNVEIYADQNSQGFDGTRVASFQSTPAGEGTFQLSNLDNGYYFFYIKVYDRIGAFSYRYADKAIAYENAGSPEKLEDVTAYCLNGDVYISWEGDNDTYKVMLFSAATNELLFEEEIRGNSCVLAFPEGHEEVLAGVASYDRNRLGKFDFHKVSAKSLPEASVVYPEENVTNQTAIFAEVAFDQEYHVSATLNQDLLLENGDRAGKYQISLKEGNNDIVFMVSDDEGNMRTFLKTIYLDSIPPQLAIKHDINKVRTGDSHIYIEGYTEAGAVLYCNDEPVELVNNYFSLRYDLSLGRNEIVISAKDVAGNEALYSAEVNRTILTGSSLRWIIIGIIGVVLLLLEMIFLVKGVKRRKNESKDESSENNRNSGNS